MGPNGLQDVNLPPDYSETENNSSLSESAPPGSLPMVVSSFSLCLTQVASMAKFDSDQLKANGSSDSDQPRSEVSNWSGTASLLVSSILSASLEYFPFDDMISEINSAECVPSPKLEEEEPLPSDENWPYIVEIFICSRLPNWNCCHCYYHCHCLCRLRP